MEVFILNLGQEEENVVTSLSDEEERESVQHDADC